MEAQGRIRLPVPARPVAGSSGQVRAVTHADRLILTPGRSDTDGVGAVVAVDGRGRLVLPVWLQRAVEPADGSGGSVLVSAREPDADVVTILPTSALDAVADTAAAGAGSVGHSGEVA